METSDLEQIADFERRFAQAQASDVVELPWGFALLQRDVPRSHMHNRIVVTSAASGADILSAADNVLGGAGLQHRYISVVDDALGRGLTAEFAAAGYTREALVAMIHVGDPDEPPRHRVDEVSLDVLRPAIVAQWRIDLPDATDDVLAQLADRTALYARGADVALLAVIDDGRVVARADLYIDPVHSIAQVEHVVTHPDARGRGFGRSLVRDAQRRAHDARCRFTFLVADLDDWPRAWYRRLGFVEARCGHEFTRLA